MSTGGTVEPAPAASRATFSGHLEIEAAPLADGRTQLATQSFRAPFHLSKPHWDGHALVVQVVNPTAGILEGDALRTEIIARSGARVLVTSPSASRVFTMRTGEAVARQAARVEAGAWLEYAPEPLVPHAGSRLWQRTEIDVAAGGSLLWSESLIPGRLARGEAWSWERLRLDLSLRIEGELCFRERFDESGVTLRRLAELAGAGQGACLANWLIVSPALVENPASWLPQIAALEGEGVRIGASALRLPGAWCVRIVARDGIHFRDTLAAARSILAARLPGLQAKVRKL